MIGVGAVLLVLAAHFAGDFVFQTDEMATRKSGEFCYLYDHVCVYAIPLLAAAWLLPSLWPEWWFLNVAAHLVVDCFSSRATARLWKAGERHWFFIVIGLDQAVHYAALFASLAWLTGKL